MQKLLTALCCSLGLLIVSCGSTKHGQSSSKKFVGTWQATPIVADGNSNDWPSPYPSYDSKALIGYAVSNDKDNLYITVETGDEKTQMKILKAGLSVYIDTNGGKKQETAIHFPLPNTDGPMEYSGMGKSHSSEYENSMLEGANNNSKVKRALESASQLTLEGFNGCNGGSSVMQDNSCGIKVHIGLDEYNELIWEAIIPFKAIYSKTEISKTDEGKPISICFAIKGFKQPATADKGNNGSGMGNQGMGMHTGSLHGSGNHGATANEYLFESTKTWRQFGIAYKAS